MNKQLSQSKERVVAKVTLRVGQPPNITLVPPGQACEVSPEDAADLRARDFIEGREESECDEALYDCADDDVSPVSVTETSELINAVVDAIDDLEPGAFGKDGKPGVKALEKLLGEEVTACDRDQAWDKYQSLLNED
ncbi:MAG: hypothetical protein K6L81_17555 [Agarilytica sp.]